MQTQTDEKQAVKQFLRNYLDKAKNKQTLDSMLQYIGGYYDADRASSRVSCTAAGTSLALPRTTRSCTFSMLIVNYPFFNR